MLTVLGLGATAAALLFYMHAKADDLYFVVAALLLAVGSLLDGLDGFLARHTGRQSNPCAFLDSFTDRVSDILVVVRFMLTSFSQ
ncbi:MAG: CDP-alcohol phosphatidyltransferase family protein [Nitrososphaerota archaeon]